MKRLVIKLNETDYLSLERLANLRELPMARLAYIAVSRLLDIERKNPRPPVPLETDEAETGNEPDAAGEQSARRLQQGVDDPIESVRQSARPEYTARIQALAALMTFDEDSLYLPLATPLLAGLMVYIALEPEHVAPRAIDTLLFTLQTTQSDFEEIIAPSVQKSDAAEGFASRQMRRVYRRPRAEREAARDFAGRAIYSFFEPAIRNETHQKMAYRHLVIVPVPDDEFTVFVNVASRASLSPAALGREAIQRLIGKGRPHLALVAGEQDKK